MITLDNKLASTPLDKLLRKEAVVAGVTLDELKNAIPLVQALVQGGVRAIELTLRTPVALAAADIIKKEFPEVVLGIGTVLTTDQVKASVEVGVDFAVAPGCNPVVIQAAQQNKLPFAPGIMTPTDIEVALSMGCKVMKFFPAESAGGMKHLTRMATPYQHLGLGFIPLGGISLENAQSYLSSPLILAIGGSWIAHRSLIQQQAWAHVEENARQICSLIQSLKEEKKGLEIGKEIIQ